MSKGKQKKKYTGEFKQMVVETMHREKLGYRETMRRFDITAKEIVLKWERIYLEEGAEGLYIERRGRACLAGGTKKGRPRKLEQQIEEDFIAEVQRLRAENAYLKKIECLGLRKGTAREKAQVIWELRHEFKVGLLIQIAGIPRSTYYYHTKHRNDEDKYFQIKEQISDIYTENKGRYGYRRITAELHNRGYTINHKTVQRLMKQLGIECVVRRKKYRSYRGQVGRIAPNLLERAFHAEKPNEKWVTDVTEFHLFGHKLYLSPILDLYSGNIVAYTIYEHPVLKMIMEMLEKYFKQYRTIQTSFFIPIKAGNTRISNTKQCSKIKVFAKA